MKVHGNAALTVRQREEMQRLNREEGWSVRRLAAHYRVNRSTVERWLARPDGQERSSAPHQHGRRTVSDAYRAAVLAQRAQHPQRGAARIALELRAEFPHANRVTVWRILRAAGLTQRQEKKKRLRHPLAVGRHRVQMDIQELPAIEGQSGREYKVSLIHLSTRLKYSEIHPHSSTQLMAEVVERAIARLPPFYLVTTDNALVFTMAYSAHPERQTAFEKRLVSLGLQHARIPRSSPWCNGFIERSNRTDNEECFHQERFSDSEQRRYRHRLWEMYYNSARPHMSLDGLAPRAVFLRDYPLIAHVVC